MKKWMWTLAALTGAGTAVLAAMGLMRSAAGITLGTCFYHFAMRLAVGYALLMLPRRYDAAKGWFAQKKWEKKLYTKLCVKRWKERVPTFNPGDFDLEKHTPQEIVQTMCVSEVVHEVNMALSFVPLLFALEVGAMPVFLVTSIAAAGYDGMFAVLQRYNRPRLMRLAERAQRRGQG